MLLLRLSRQGCLLKKGCWLGKRSLKRGLNSKEDKESKYRCKNAESLQRYRLSQEKWLRNCLGIRLKDPIRFKLNEIKRCFSNRRSNIWKRLRIFSFDLKSTKNQKRCSDKQKICMNGTIKRNKISNLESFRTFEPNSLNTLITDKYRLILKSQRIKKQISL